MQRAGGTLRAIERVYEVAPWLAAPESQRMLVGTVVAADIRMRRDPFRRIGSAYTNPGILP